MDPHEEIIRRIIDGSISSLDDLQRAKIEMCKKYGLESLPGNADILKTVESMEDVTREDVIDLLRRKPSRTRSGVTVIAVMTSPAPCPHGKCTMCPGGPDGETPSPQSYTGREPAALRGSRHDFQAMAQVSDRLEQYHAIGHPTDKVDLIIMGGTFPARPWEYQRAFVKGCLDGLNQEYSNSLGEAQQRNERAKNRCIGLTVETRPDICGTGELKKMNILGVTRVELGVQSVNDILLKNVQRGHTVEDTIDATKLTKDHGLKVCYHIMPGLPGSTPEGDLEDFKSIFREECFRPDMIKIYPTLVIKGTKLYQMWKRGEYTPLTTEGATELVSRMKEVVPEYVRIQRVQRDIPSQLIYAGVKKSNLRQYATRIMDERGTKCMCIRCREAGRSSLKVPPEDVVLNRTVYNASGGTEYFIELAAGNLLVAYSRLRISSSNEATIRELKVVGEMTPIYEAGTDYQHMGYGKWLVDECEAIALGYDANSIRVTSGIGARDYYRNMGYKLKKGYMVKCPQP